MLLEKFFLKNIVFLTLLCLTVTNLNGKSIFSPIIEVNNSIITQFELIQRTRLVEALNLSSDPALFAREQLITERLKQDEAKKLKITASNQELSLRLEQFASRANLSIIDFYKELRQLGIYPSTLETYLETEIIWRKIVNSKFDPTTSISDLEIQTAMNRAQFEDIFQVLLTEIIIPISSDNANDTEALIQKLREVRSIEEFSNAARKYSVAPTAASGGLVTWQKFSDLPEILKPLILGLSPGEITEPVKLTKAVAIFQVRNVREVINNSDEQKLISFINLTTNSHDKSILENIQNTYFTCEDLKRTFNENSEVQLIQIKSLTKDLSDQTLKIIENLDPRESKVVVFENKPQLFFLCERNRIQLPETKDQETVRRSIQQSRLNKFAKSYLDALRYNARIVNK